MLSVQQNTEDQITITISGDFDALAAETTRQELVDIAASWKGNVSVDMSQVNFLDSSGVGALVFLSKRMAEKSQTVSLTGVSGQPGEVIQMLRIDRSIPVQFRA